MILMKNSKSIRIALIAFVAVLGLCLIPSTTSYETVPSEAVTVDSSPLPEIKLKEAEAKIEVRPVLNPALKRVCSCESTGKPNNEPQQFEADGSVKKGKQNPLDTGMCQINLHYHQATAERMGLDLFTEEGNIEYANWLYAREGLTPWNWSRSCWE